MTSQQEALSRYVTKFLDGDNEGCLGTISELSQDETPTTMRLMALICMQRCGLHAQVEEVSKLWDEVEFADPFVRELTGLLLGRISLDQLLSVAADDEERCEAYFFAGEVALTAGELETATGHFGQCARMKVETYAGQIGERRFVTIGNLAIMEAFRRRNYAKARDIALDSGRVVAEGLAVSLLCMQRLGELGRQKEFASGAGQASGWESVIPSLVLGQLSLEQALSPSISPEQECFMRFCHGARLRTLLQDEEAMTALQSCLDMQIDCHGAALARAELRSLGEWGDGSGGGVDEAGVAEACYEGFCRGDYWRVTDTAREIAFDAAPWTLVLTYLISQQRLGRAREVAKVRAAYTKKFADDFSREIIKVALDGAPKDDALRISGDDAQRCAGYFYSAAWLQTSNKHPTGDLISAGITPVLLRDSGSPERGLARGLLGIGQGSAVAARGCVEAFERDNYAACYRLGLEWLEAGGTELLPLHLTIIALGRVGYFAAAEAIGQSVLADLKTDQRHERLLRLSLGLATFDEVRRDALDSQQSLQAALFAAARLATLGHREDAVRILREAVATPDESKERSLARRELARLDPVFAGEVGRGLITKPWQRIKLFVSSTFRDMHAEREHLLRVVFPQLRRLCAKRRLFFSEIDLRWGVADEENSFERCRREIQSSHIFICLLGERYGWLSLPPSVSPETLSATSLSESEREELFGFFPEGRLRDGPTGGERQRVAELLVRAGLPGAARSITALEIDFAASGDHAPLCFFYFREPKLARLVPESHAVDYLPESPWAEQNLCALKQEIRSRLEERGDYVRTYGSPARWSDSEVPAWDSPVPGCFVGLEEFGNQVLADLVDAVELLAPGPGEHANADEQDSAMEAVVQEHLHSRVFAGRSEIFGALLEFATSAGEHSSSRMGCLNAPSGSGKSALFARLASALSGQQNTLVLWHFVGATPESTVPAEILKRFARKLGADEESIEEAKGNKVKLRSLVERLLEQAGRQRRVVLLLDGLDQLDHSDDSTLDWLPQALPDEARVLLSFIHNQDAEAETLEWGYREAGRLDVQLRSFTLGPLSSGDREEIIRNYLDIFGKSRQSFAREDLDRLVEKPEAGLPLYLLLALDDLRTTGGNKLHLKIREHVRRLPPTAQELFLRVLDRLTLQNQDHPPLVETILSAICLSRSRAGVTEHELNLFAKHACGSRAEGAYARVLTALRPYLVERPDERYNLRVSFSHEQFFQASEIRLGLHEEGKRREFHRRLARSLFSATKSAGGWKGRAEAGELMYRALIELLYHLRSAHQEGRLTSVLCDLRFIDAACGHGQAARLVDEYTQTLSAWQGFKTLSPFAEPPALPGWLPERTRAFVEARDDPHPDEGAGPALGLLRRSTQQTVPLTLWDVSRARLLHRLEGHLWDVISVAMTPDTKWVASASADGTVRVWDGRSGECVHVLNAHRHPVQSVDITDDGRHALSVDSDGLLCYWELRGGTLLGNLKTHLRRIHLAADGSTAVGVGESQWHSIDLLRGVLHESRTVPYCGASASAKLADSLVTAQRDGTLSIWHTRLRARVSDLIDPACDKQPEVTCLAITPGGEYVVSGSADNTIRLWDAFACELLRSIPTGHEAVSTIAITPDGARGVSTGKEGSLCFWNLEAGLPLLKFEVGGTPPTAIALSADGRTAVTAINAAELRAQRFETPRDSALPPLSLQQQVALDLLRPAEGRPADVSATATHRAVSDFTGPLWKVEEFARFVTSSLDRLMAPDCDRIAFAYQSSGSPFIAARASRLLERRRTPWVVSEWVPKESGQPALSAALIAHRGLVISGIRKVSASADGLDIACLPSWEDSVQVWDLRTKSLRLTLRGHGSNFKEVEVSQDGRRVLAGCEDGSVRVWDGQTGKSLNTLGGDDGPAGHIRLSADGGVAVTLTGEGLLCVWNLRDGTCMRRMQTRHKGANGLAITDDARVGVTSSYQKEHTVWDLSEGMPLRTFYHDLDSINVEALTPDGRFAVSKQFRKVWFWELLTGTLLLDSKSEGTLQAVSRDAAWALWSHKDWLELRALPTNEFAKRVRVSGWVVGATTLTAGGTAAVISAEAAGESVDPTTALLACDFRAGLDSEADERPMLALRGVARAPGERVVAYIAGEDFFLLADPSSGTVLRRFAPPDGYPRDIHCLAIAPNGRTLASGGASRQIDLWDAPSGRRLFSLGKANNLDMAVGHVEAVLTLAFSPDGFMALSGSQDNTVRVWELKSRSCRHTLGARFNTNSLKGHWMPIVDVAISPDGRKAASAGLDGLIHIWDLVYGVSHIRLGDDDGGNGGVGVNAVVFTPDGRFLVAGLMNRTVRVWDCRDGECVAVHISAEVVTALRCIGPAGRIICCTDEHRAWVIKLCNFDLALPIVTASAQWFPDYDDLRRSYSEPHPVTSDPLFGDEDVIPGQQKTVPAFWCPYCQGRSMLSAEVLDTIQGIGRSASLPADESPCLTLPQEAWSEVALTTKCQLCQEPLRLNPFLANGAMTT